MVVVLPYSPIFLILLVYVTICFPQELSGYVCPYRLTGIRSETRLKAVFSNECQCDKPRIVLVNVSYTETVNGYCRGWIQTGNNCSFPCKDNTFGLNCTETCNCTSVNSYCNPVRGCSCMAGWKEPNCSSPCDAGSYGFACMWNCTCLNNASCDPETGSCNCTPGWTGSYCNVTCPAGRYGNDCQENCTCLEGAVCDPVNGSCSSLPDRIGPNCTFLEESTTHQTKCMQECNPFERDSNDPQILLMVAVSGVSFAVGIAIGFIICILYKRYRYTNHIRARSTGVTHAQRNAEAATQSGLQTSEAGAMLISSETSKRPDECTTSRGNVDVMRMYETTVTQSDDRTRNQDEDAPSRVSRRHQDHSRVSPSTASTPVAEVECAYCEVGEVNTPLQSTPVHNTQSGEIEHTYYQRNTQL